MKELLLFTDGSVNPNSKQGFGAYLLVTEFSMPIDFYKKQVKIKSFENTSSTKLELECLLWALNETNQPGKSIIVYTDSQNIIKLPDRQLRLEKNDYFTNKNKRIKNYKLYKEFYRLTALLNCKFVKIKGHQVTKHKAKIDHLFTLVDRATRKVLKEFLQTNDNIYE